MNKAKVMRKAEAGEGLTVAEIKVYQKAVKPEKQVYGKYGTLAKQYLEEKKTLSARVSESEAIVTENEKNTADVDEFIRRLKKYASAEELTREMCIELIERITIGKVVKDKTAEREIHIYYKFMDNGYSEKLHTN